MRYSFISAPLYDYLSDKNVIREIKSSAKIISFASEVDQTLYTCIRKLQKNNKTLFYFSLPSAGYKFTAAGELTTINESGIGRFHATDKHLKQIKNKIITNWDNLNINIPLFTGGLKFTIEHNEHEWKDFPDSSWSIPELILLTEKGKTWLIYNFFLARNQLIESVIQNLEVKLDSFLSDCKETVHNSVHILSSSGDSPKDKKKWKNLVYKGLDEIYDDKIKKVVLSRKVDYILSGEINFDTILPNLEDSFPGCAVFLYKKNNSNFFGASPEKLISYKNKKITLDALAGSSGNSLNQSNLFSEKNLKEHDFVIEHIKDTLAPFSENIEIPRFHDTKKLNNISHIWSEISAELNDNNPLFLVIRELFPTPAVCGIPKEAAHNVIKKLEDHRRGLYSGIIGWFNFSSAELYVSIRSALNYGNKLTAYAGCGIVDGSDPEDEFDETELKLIPILSLFKNENKSQPQYTLG